MTSSTAGFLAALCALVSCSSDASTRERAQPRALDEVGIFVIDGQARSVVFDGAPWTREKSALVGSGTGRFLFGDRHLGAGDFVVEARMTIEKLRGSAASFVIGDSHFGFSGRDGRMFTEGGLLGRRDLETSAVSEAKAFDFMVERVGSKLRFSVDGKQLVTAEVKNKDVVRIGLRPWRSTMRVEQFSARGSFVTPPKQLPHTDVFARGAGAYHTYRIPAIVVTNAGTLLAFCEGRKSGGGDAGDIDMLVSRSLDSGKTWSKPIVIWDDEGNTCGNPCPVVDRSTGVIWLPMTWNLGTDHERDIMSGRSEQPRHVFIAHSKDDGKTWSEPVRISKSTRKPHWRWYATGPGNAIQLTRGPHAGRMVIPANHSDHTNDKAHPYRSHVVYSDDHGQTWKLGGVHEDRTNESAVVELLDGSILQQMRSYHGKNNRAMATSRDGGVTWSELYLDDALQTPVCQASILRYSWPDAHGGRSRILFSSPTGTKRSRLTVWLSYDEGKTWPVQKQIYAGGSAYSNLVRLPDDSVGVLYEKDGYRSVSLVTFEMKWLEGK